MHKGHATFRKIKHSLVNIICRSRMGGGGRYRVGLEPTLCKIKFLIYISKLSKIQKYASDPSTHPRLIPRQFYICNYLSNPLPPPGKKFWIRACTLFFVYIYIYTSVTRNRTPTNQCKQLANIIELAESSSVSGHSKFGLIKIALKE